MCLWQLPSGCQVGPHCSVGGPLRTALDVLQARAQLHPEDSAGLLVSNKSQASVQGQGTGGLQAQCVGAYLISLSVFNTVP